jgi:peptide/nickel transport system substrate-binding protein
MRKLAFICATVFAVALPTFIGGHSVGGASAAEAGNVRRAVTVATSGLPSILDPDKAVGSADTMFAGNVFESLIQLNPTPSDGRGRHVPALATSWTISPDGKSIDFKLRQGVVFHDGTPMTAEDVKFSIDRAVAPETKNPYRSSWLANIEGADILDAATVRIRLSRAWAGTMDSLAARGQIMPKAYLERVGDDGFAKAPIGTGPLVFLSRKIGDAVEFKTFDHHWAKQPNATTVTWRQVPDLNTRIALLSSGEVDLITDILPSLTSTIESSGAKVQSLRGIFQRFLVINTLAGGPLADRRVRLALNLALDRKTLFKAVFGRDVPLLNGPLSATQIGGDGAEPYPYDPDRAKKLLAEAGLPNGFTTELNYASGRYIGEDELLPAFVSYWKRIGVHVDIKPMEQAKWIEVSRTKAYTGMLSFSKAVGQVADPFSAFDRHIHCGGLYSGYCNKELDALVDSAVGVIDEHKLEQVFAQAQKLAHDDAAQIFLFDEPYLIATKPGVKWAPEYGPDGGWSWNYITTTR